MMSYSEACQVAARAVKLINRLSTIGPLRQGANSIALHLKTSARLSIIDLHHSGPKDTHSAKELCEARKNFESAARGLEEIPKEPDTNYSQTFEQSVAYFLDSKNCFLSQRVELLSRAGDLLVGEHNKRFLNDPTAMTAELYSACVIRLRAYMSDLAQEVYTEHLSGRYNCMAEIEQVTRCLDHVPPAEK